MATAQSQNKSLIIEVQNLDSVLGDTMHFIANVATASVCEITDAEKDSIEGSFRAVSFALAGMIVVSTVACWWLLARWQVLPLIAIVAGFLGSSTAALRSCLDRHAQGIEDKDGHQWPDPRSKKERFNRRMAVWFWYRPVLGAVVGFMVYLAGAAGVFNRAHSAAGLAFFALIGGLFAKSLLDFLLEKSKTLFGL